VFFSSPDRLRMSFNLATSLIILRHRAGGKHRGEKVSGQRPATTLRHRTPPWPRPPPRRERVPKSTKRKVDVGPEDDDRQSAPCISHKRALHRIKQRELLIPAHQQARNSAAASNAGSKWPKGGFGSAAPAEATSDPKRRAAAGSILTSA
jgi:hypothetical protein